MPERAQQHYSEEHSHWLPWLLIGLAFLFLAIIAILRGLCTDAWYVRIFGLNERWCPTSSATSSGRLNLADGSVTGAKIAGETITFQNLSPQLQQFVTNTQQLTQNISSPIPGPAGATGLQGATGPTGPAGPVGVATAQNGTFLSGTTLEFGTNPLLHNTTLPQNGFDLTLDATGGGGNLIATGTYGAGTALTTSGAGTRMLWYPKKAALRAGTVTGSQWDDANVGDYSIAVGQDTVASGIGSFAGGSNSVASGTGSIALGFSTTASNIASVAFGGGTTASGQRHFLHCIWRHNYG